MISETVSDGPSANVRHADAIDEEASKLYDVLALLDALAVLGEVSLEHGASRGDSVSRLATMAHVDLLAITENLYAVRDQLKVEAANV
jgi:hypothetical protein